jgi:hypothetical protein
MRALPRVARISPIRILIAVVLPAPLAPMKPKASPGSTVSDTPPSATTGADRHFLGYFFSRSSMAIAGSIILYSKALHSTSATRSVQAEAIPQRVFGKLGEQAAAHQVLQPLHAPAVTLAKKRDGVLQGRQITQPPGPDLQVVAESPRRRVLRPSPRPFPPHWRSDNPSRSTGQRHSAAPTRPAGS